MKVAGILRGVQQAAENPCHVVLSSAGTDRSTAMQVPNCGTTMHPHYSVVFEISAVN